MIQEKSGREFLKSVLNCDCHCLVNSICSGLAGGVVHRVKLARVTERGNLEETTPAYGVLHKDPSITCAYY